MNGERNKQPDLVRKAGPHVKPEKAEPDVCYACGGAGMIEIANCQAVTCQVCGGTGEV